MFNPNDVVTLLAANRRSGPCEDDVEVTCPFVDMLPEESDAEEGSPLDFGNDRDPWGGRRMASTYFAQNERRWR